MNDKVEVWFDGDYSECWYGIGPLSKECFAGYINNHEFMQGEEPCKIEDIEETVAKNYDNERIFFLGSKHWDDCIGEPYRLLIWDPFAIRVGK